VAAVSPLMSVWAAVWCRDPLNVQASGFVLFLLITVENLSRWLFRGGIWNGRWAWE